MVLGCSQDRPARTAAFWLAHRRAAGFKAPHAASSALPVVKPHLTQYLTLVKLPVGPRGGHHGVPAGRARHAAAL